mmetsp:Transcript_13106/g.18069  ORF Transcript_13106/g.18069 Transcript_13106/m.18069 type:complete len:201 (+) Transcript_13106:52-654(+)
MRKNPTCDIIAKSQNVVLFLACDFNPLLDYTLCIPLSCVRIPQISVSCVYVFFFCSRVLPPNSFIHPTSVCVCVCLCGSLRSFFLDFHPSKTLFIFLLAKSILLSWWSSLPNQSLVRVSHHTPITVRVLIPLLPHRPFLHVMPCRNLRLSQKVSASTVHTIIKVSAVPVVAVVVVVTVVVVVPVVPAVTVSVVVVVVVVV